MHRHLLSVPITKRLPYMVLQQHNSMEDEIDNLPIRIEPMFHIFYGLDFLILMPLIKHFDLWRGPLIVSIFFFFKLVDRILIIQLLHLGNTCLSGHCCGRHDHIIVNHLFAASLPGFSDLINSI